jgi:prevent-host-death family protein
METISKTAFRARMPEHLRRVEETGQELVVTDRGRPVVA